MLLPAQSVPSPEDLHADTGGIMKAISDSGEGMPPEAAEEGAAPQDNAAAAARPPQGVQQGPAGLSSQLQDQSNLVEAGQLPLTSSGDMLLQQQQEQQMHKKGGEPVQEQQSVPSDGGQQQQELASDGQQQQHAVPSEGAQQAPSSEGAQQQSGQSRGRLKPSKGPPVCQVDGCGLDLASDRFKDYHRRSRVCIEHMKSLSVSVRDVDSRYCHQCHKFHNTSAFDHNMHACRVTVQKRSAKRHAKDLADVGESSSAMPSQDTKQSRPKFDDGAVSGQHNLESTRKLLEIAATHGNLQVQLSPNQLFQLTQQQQQQQQPRVLTIMNQPRLTLQTVPQGLLQPQRYTLAADSTTADRLQVQTMLEQMVRERELGNMLQQTRPGLELPAALQQQGLMSLEAQVLNTQQLLGSSSAAQLGLAQLTPAGTLQLPDQGLGLAHRQHGVSAISPAGTFFDAGQLGPQIPAASGQLPRQLLLHQQHPSTASDVDSERLQMQAMFDAVKREHERGNAVSRSNIELPSAPQGRLNQMLSPQQLLNSATGPSQSGYEAASGQLPELRLDPQQQLLLLRSQLGQQQWQQQLWNGQLEQQLLQSQGAGQADQLQQLWQGQGQPLEQQQQRQPRQQAGILDQARLSPVEQLLLAQQQGQANRQLWQQQLLDQQPQLQRQSLVMSSSTQQQQEQQRPNAGSDGGKAGGSEGTWQDPQQQQQQQPEVALERLSVLLHGVTPDMLPPGIKDRLRAWISTSGFDPMQGFTRPGSTMLVFDLINMPPLDQYCTPDASVRRLLSSLGCQAGAPTAAAAAAAKQQSGSVASVPGGQENELPAANPQQLDNTLLMPDAHQEKVAGGSASQAHSSEALDLAAALQPAGAPQSCLPFLEDVLGQALVAAAPRIILQAGPLTMDINSQDPQAQACWVPSSHVGQPTLHRVSPMVILAGSPDCALHIEVERQQQQQQPRKGNEEQQQQQQQPQKANEEQQRQEAGQQVVSQGQAQARQQLSGQHEVRVFARHKGAFLRATRHDPKLNHMQACSVFAMPSSHGADAGAPAGAVSHTFELQVPSSAGLIAVECGSKETGLMSNWKPVLVVEDEAVQRELLALCTGSSQPGEPSPALPPAVAVEALLVDLGLMLQLYGSCQGASQQQQGKQQQQQLWGEEEQHSRKCSWALAAACRACRVLSAWLLHWQLPHTSTMVLQHLLALQQQQQAAEQPQQQQPGTSGFSAAACCGPCEGALAPASVLADSVGSPGDSNKSNATAVAAAAVLDHAWSGGSTERPESTLALAEPGSRSAKLPMLWAAAVVIKYLVAGILCRQVEVTNDLQSSPSHHSSSAHSLRSSTTVTSSTSLTLRSNTSNTTASYSAFNPAALILQAQGSGSDELELPPLGPMSSRFLSRQSQAPELMRSVKAGHKAWSFLTPSTLGLLLQVNRLLVLTLVGVGYLPMPLMWSMLCNLWMDVAVDALYSYMEASEPPALHAVLADVAAWYLVYRRLADPLAVLHAASLGVAVCVLGKVMQSHNIFHGRLLNALAGSVREKDD